MNVCHQKCFKCKKSCKCRSTSKCAKSALAEQQLRMLGAVDEQLQGHAFIANIMNWSIARISAIKQGCCIYYTPWQTQRGPKITFSKTKN
ncbi:hypothetical protein XELAEV_18028622mg [Xenopus laevis]|uniref:Uncharacterized protein n=1 Tax=Xenopus laevis TaxID=8355 RepID=A0A974CQ11_XENLA|nr:hypothetical protein XELAEV_18028622mg [Xenopus laevis]